MFKKQGAFKFAHDDYFLAEKENLRLLSKCMSWF